jgi:hypothetical protein
MLTQIRHLAGFYREARPWSFLWPHVRAQTRAHAPTPVQCTMTPLTFIGAKVRS